MKIFDKIKNYINELDYKIIITDTYINIVNYKEIIDFKEDKITVRHSNGLTCIKGKNLVVSKMLEDEILITGDFINVLLKGEK